jgi:predicted DsbA family dithiol-disulfide isomerase
LPNLDDWLRYQNVTTLNRISTVPAVVIAVHADPVCPWCYIGKRRLDRALALAGADDVTVQWRAFQLNPTMPAQGMERGLYLAAKFGGADRARQIYDAIRREGAADGINFAFARITRTPNTLQAHRLIRLAARSGLASVVIERLFVAYFLDSRDIGSNGVLAGIAADAGIDRAVAEAFLAGGDEAEAVLAEDRAAREAGIGGVPHFTIAERYVLPGAQSPEVIVRTIELARASLNRQSHA